ncbi:unnamed protein product, partial [Oikopleura dioica]
KFDAVQKNFQKFFDVKQPFGTPQDSYVEIYEKIEEILPTFFKQVIGVAPKRRVAAILVHTCLAMPFTENELLMHCFNARFISCEDVKAFFMRHNKKEDPETVRSQAMVPLNPAEKKIFHRHFTLPKDMF